MRTPYLSPSSLACWDKDREEFYIRYLAESRPPRMPQTQAMAVGSAFDAFVKGWICEFLGGENKWEMIFESSVEPQNRDIAIVDGRIVFDAYRELGLLADLVIMLDMSFTEPRVEMILRESVSGEIGGVPILGKPDLMLSVETSDGVIPVVLDWKVNGFYSSASPKRGYYCMRPSGSMHKDCVPMLVNGIFINVAEGFETIDSSWADQLATYLWLDGEVVGTRALCVVHQIVRGKDSRFRACDFRGQVGLAWQKGLLERYVKCWKDVLEWRDSRLEIVAKNFCDGGAFMELTRHV